jgi:hypothetical protein
MSANDWAKQRFAGRSAALFLLRRGSDSAIVNFPLKLFRSSPFFSGCEASSKLSNPGRRLTLEDVPL